MVQPFEVITEEHAGFALVRVTGEFDLAAVEAVETAMLTVEARHPLVILDLRGVSFLDSTGLRAIVSADSRSREGGSELKIVRGSEAVQKLLYLAGLDKILPLIDPDELPEALTRSSG